MNRKINMSVALALIATFGIVGLTGTASAYPQYLDTYTQVFQVQYAHCSNCHMNTNSGGELHGFGIAFANQPDHASNPWNAMKRIGISGTENNPAYPVYKQDNDDKYKQHDSDDKYKQTIPNPRTPVVNNPPPTYSSPPTPPPTPQPVYNPPPTYKQPPIPPQKSQPLTVVTVTPVYTPPRVIVTPTPTPTNIPPCEDPVSFYGAGRCYGSVARNFISGLLHGFLGV